MATPTERSMAYIKSMNYFNKDNRLPMLHNMDNDSHTKKVIKFMGVDLTDADIEKIFNALITGDTELLR